MTQKELEQLFSQYGRIITSRILVDQVTGEYKMAAVTQSSYILILNVMAAAISGTRSAI